ncbi:diguanylate cyclase (GGDEF)-like protein [Motilibacter rhizosphaerae]|uniref:Diguanylate cyclase (GGDEF)-like protein n=1 Tax=Motilibacter rhizosphaerae TaxID=598652 RepID=A0A4V2F4M4_9ACTN|nr:sensor domain-containing diguanylate cyclase [Motilibacter rhizosphaerae]RZS89829.1 diguanylate cyclase (GGDEF)-like protein [Motilibacter rhizosphaerae]
MPGTGTTSEGLLDAVFESLPGQVAVLDADGVVLLVNRAWREFAERAGGAQCGPGTSFFGVCARAQGAAAGEAALAAAGVRAVLDGVTREFTMDVACDTPLGRLWFSASAVPLLSGSGALLSYLEITERKQSEVRAAYRAAHDPLTGLPNRFLLQDRLAHALAAASRGDVSVALLFLDVDAFKRVNDRFGHVVGDAVLVEVARRLRRCVRPGDTVGRLAGDEFVVVCAGPRAAASAGAIARRVETAMAEPVLVEHGALRLGVSTGIAMGRPGDDADEVLRRADEAMFRAKAGRR